MNKLSMWLLNGVVGLFFYFLFLFIFFPIDILVENMLSKIQTQTRGIYRVSVGQTDASLLFKSNFQDFQVHQNINGQEKIIVDFPKIKIGINYLPLIYGKAQIQFLAESQDGELEGYLSLSENEYRIRLDFNEFSLKNFPIIKSYLKTDFSGLMDGKVDLLVNSEIITLSEGDIELNLLNFNLPEGKLTPYPGFEMELPTLDLSTKKAGKVSIKMRRGKIAVREISFPGEDVILDLRGRLQLNKKFLLSRMSLTGKLKLSKKLEDAAPILQIIEKQKDDEGSYPLSFTGRFTKPQIQIGSFDLSNFGG